MFPRLSSTVCCSLHARSLCVGPSGVRQTDFGTSRKPQSWLTGRIQLRLAGFLYHLFEHFVEMLDRVFTSKRIKALKFFLFFFEGVRLDLVLNWIFICEPRIVKQHSSWHLFLFLSNHCLWQKICCIFYHNETLILNVKPGYHPLWTDLTFILFVSVEWELPQLFTTNVGNPLS